jgi:hydrogenase-4 transcriptional activator
MEPFRETLLAVWRETCRHIEINESTSTVAQLLSRNVPVECILVRRFDLQHAVLETVAFGRLRSSRVNSPGKSALPVAKLTRMISWAGEGRVLRGTGSKRAGVLQSIVPSQLPGEVIAGPLTNAEGPAGALALVAKPDQTFDAEHLALFELLLEPFSVALENDRRLHELAALREAAEADRRSLLTRLGRKEIGETVVGSDSGLKLVMERIGLVSQSDVPVLILGETGTGKEVVARAIHSRSPRVAGAFIRVNCGAIPSELIDSQLFGHERGSFTGAADTRKGWFERADGGTLFLDEIGELPLEAQVRLLRVLQDGYIERVGGHDAIRVDVRIVAATHRDLAAMVKEGTFREDLWYRIAVFPILLPPLRDRLEDVAALARHFAERAATRFGLAFVAPTAEDLHTLMNYSWPGNIRELGAVIDRAAILGEGKRLEVAKSLGVPASVPRRAETASLEFSTGGDSLLTLDAAMREHIERALDATRGRIEGPNGVAALLKINPHTLRARMRKLGIRWSSYRAPKV